MENLLLDLETLENKIEELTRAFLIEYHHQGTSTQAIDIIASIYRDNIRPRVDEWLQLLVDDVFSTRCAWMKKTQHLERELVALREREFSSMSHEESRQIISVIFSRCLIAPWREIESDINDAMDLAMTETDQKWCVFGQRYSPRTRFLLISNEGDYRIAMFNKLVEDKRIPTHEKMVRSCQENSLSMSMTLPTIT